ncbi:MAG TPA: glycosyltransferase [Silvibacterium sp.]|nr:glycosyltransferase [Silvibacterium sp.]
MYVLDKDLLDFARSIDVQDFEFLQRDACQQGTCFRSPALVENDRRYRSVDLTNVSIDFSVVIPTFRRPHGLIEAISSVLRQHDSTIEIFVVDDSPEGSAEDGVNSLRDSRIIYCKNPNPTGGAPSVVRNIGWPMARGAFVHFLDDDDIVAEGYYAAVKAAFAANPTVGLVFGRIEPFGSGPAAQLDQERQYFADAARKSAASDRFGPRFAFTGRMLFGNALLVCSSSVIRRECVTRLGGFDPSIRLMEDADFHVRAMRECGALFLDRTAIHYRVGSPSLMHSPHPTEAQKQSERLGHRQMQAKYRRERGTLEFYALALFTRTVLKVF